MWPTALNEFDISTLDRLMWVRFSKLQEGVGRFLASI